jgi:hypothetical protein
MRRRFTTAAASLLAATACSAFLFSAVAARAQSSAASCEEATEVTVLPSPLSPWKGAPLRVVVTSEKPLDGELSLIAPNGNVATKTRDRRGGPPYFWYAEVAQPVPGAWHASLARDRATGDCSTIIKEIAVADRQPAPIRPTDGVLWPIRNTWNRGTENLYSAWIEKLFDAPDDAAPSWKALHEVLRDPSRNLLYDHLGLREDKMGLIIRPDCADLPYFLRAYFSFKMGLPFGYSKCTRGGRGEPPRCHSWWNIQNLEPPPPPKPGEEEIADAPPETVRMPFPMSAPQASVAPPPNPMVALKRLGLAQGFGQYVSRAVADGVHSGSGRTKLSDENTDYYPVPLTADALRPGTMYADPYGHMLVLAKRVPQKDGAAGVFLAVDAQPDATVARKRFWRGNFLFAQDPALGGPGFKRFRPIVRERNGTLRRLTNDEIAKNPQYADFSLEQAKLDIDGFYDKMDDVMSPAPLDPMTAMKDAIASLEEQVKTRVVSVENGRKWLDKSRGDATMPDGAVIFETSGAWEDFATPSRDLRLLIAMDVVRHFPERVERRPDRYAMPKDKSAADVKAEMESVLATELASRKFSYTRTDGSQWTLTLKDVMERVSDLEMAYNLNDCVELRWGATAQSPEAATCKRHAPQTQHVKMAEYRAWFHERRRPARP